MIADGGVDTGVATFLILVALTLGLVAWMRLRDRGFRRLPKPLGWAAAAGAAVALAGAILLPQIIRPEPAAVRPSTSARLSFDSPQAGQVLHGDPATVPVRLRLEGGRIVPFTSRNLVSNAGHLHIYLDDRLVTMTAGLETTITATPGIHRLEADFVAVDHAPFQPAVRVFVSFRVRT